MTLNEQQCRTCPKWRRRRLQRGL